MKKLILILTFLFPVSSFADWTKLGNNNDDTTYYLDVETIKESNGLVYYWLLIDYLKPIESGILSAKQLQELNCNTPRKERTLSASYYSKRMGKGTRLGTVNKEQEWMYSQPNTVLKVIIDNVCGLNDLYKRDIK